MEISWSCYLISDLRPRWPSGKISTLGPEGSGLEIRFHRRSAAYGTCCTLNHTQWPNVLPKQLSCCFRTGHEEEEEKPVLLNAPPLYVICLVRALDFLKTTEWKTSGKNLLSILTNQVVHDLWSSAFRLPKTRGQLEYSVKESYQLVAQGGLQHLDMREKERDEQDLVLSMLTADACKDLRTILCQGLHFFTNNDAIDAVVRLSPNLEELHYPEFVSLDAFENCKKIRILKFHRLNEGGSAYFHNEDAQFPESLKNLEIFGFCSLYQSSIYVPNITSRILENCPKVVSVGCTDSSGALELIRQKDVDSLRHFQLRRCYWAKDYHQNPENDSSPLHEIGQFSVIQTAVRMCPFVEELIIKVSDPSCLSHLKELQNLSVLHVGFDEKSDENILELISLLKIIGPQLKHLRIEDKGEIPVDGILEYCSKLQSLHIQGTMIVPESFKTSVGDIHLERLNATKTDESSLLTLLSKCRYLTELVLEMVPWLNDDLLLKIIKENRFSKLEVFMIFRHDFSNTSYELLLENMIHLQNIGVPSHLEYRVRCLARDMGFRAKVHKYFEYVGYHDFFSKLFDKCRF
ncbi:hypothetical protein AVEN_170022-1 [Araneus ventricosus]|uniref:Uncharacterized protein n=1 Tax=Araneus ventricosus TaxID=182803 RepID=A0A4Y2V014_ARAVE|nr:hypothetical protein AVEN_170022-1 [Araneus ventricosus]